MASQLSRTETWKSPSAGSTARMLIREASSTDTAKTVSMPRPGPQRESVVLSPTPRTALY
jgi:hypothetical protein